MFTKISDSVSNRFFQYVHGNYLVYNTCWEDPRLDREALEITRADEIAMITSAGCNVLDYVLQDPARVHAIDMNPRQNALLELKISAICNLPYDDYFDMFGRGRLAGERSTYLSKLRPALSPPAREYWDRHIDAFFGSLLRKSFYFHGTSGVFARTINLYIDLIPKLRGAIQELLECATPHEQRELYEEEIEPVFWTGFINWLMRRDATLACLGVPRAQRVQVERFHPGGMTDFVRQAIESVFCDIPISDNYFWRVYLTGQYSPECCPEYLREENFETLRSIAPNKVSIFYGSLIDFLRQHDGEISKFVLLDHMDWLWSTRPELLAEEWEEILRHARRGSRAIWRSGGLDTNYLNSLPVRQPGGRLEPLQNSLHFHDKWAEELHKRDRVHTYGSFHIADVVYH